MAESANTLIVSVRNTCYSRPLADHYPGRTARIGNAGKATSFFNDRDDALAAALVTCLIECGQPVPDFLRDHVPEGFIADVESGIVTGDLAQLRFDEDYEEEAAVDGTQLPNTESTKVDTGGAWGSGAGESTGGWGTDTNTQVKADGAAASAGWGF